VATLAIRINNQAGINEAVVKTAQEIISGAFHEAGTRVVWPEIGGAPRADFVVNVVTASPSIFGLKEDVVAVAAPGGSLAWVFQPSLERVVDEAWAKMPVKNRLWFWSAMLGYVAAHEVAHLLLDGTGHTDWGIMTPRWHSDALVQACSHQLRFPPAQSRQLRSAARKWSDSKATVVARNKAPLRANP
jgi:hypothetical protein